MNTYPAWHKRIVEFMKCLDVSFSDIEVTSKEFDVSVLDDAPNGIKDELISRYKGARQLFARSIYKTPEDKTCYLDFHEESDGTKSILSYSGPILDTLEKGGVLVADELQRSLHPHALEQIIKVFQNPKSNPNKAQIIFTTHETKVMNALERGQIWLVEKSKDFASELISIGEFNGRADEAVEKRYLAGTYGALPNLTGLLFNG